MSLVTRCPKCHSDFAVRLEQLQALDGLALITLTTETEGQAQLPGEHLTVDFQLAIERCGRVDQGTG